MSYRVFARVCWKANESWPLGYEPHAIPQDACCTLHSCETREEAVEYCNERNEIWCKHSLDVLRGNATPAQKLIHFTKPRYEWVEV